MKWWTKITVTQYSSNSTIKYSQGYLHKYSTKCLIMSLWQLLSWKSWIITRKKSNDLSSFNILKYFNQILLLKTYSYHWSHSLIISESSSSHFSINSLSISLLYSFYPVLSMVSLKRTTFGFVTFRIEVDIFKNSGNWRCYRQIIRILVSLSLYWFVESREVSSSNYAFLLTRMILNSFSLMLLIVTESAYILFTFFPSFYNIDWAHLDPIDKSNTFKTTLSC